MGAPSRINRPAPISKRLQATQRRSGARLLSAPLMIAAPPSPFKEIRGAAMISSECLIRTCHEFIVALAEQSPAIGAMALHNRMIDAPLGADAFNLANCAAH